MSDYADRWNAALDRQVVQPQRELREAKKEIERLRARIEEQHGEIGLLLKRIEELERLLRRYRREVLPGHQPPMIAHEADELLEDER